MFKYDTKYDYKKKKIRRCYWSHHCQLCGNDITDGQYYHDGGSNSRRAHVDCAERNKAYITGAIVNEGI